MKKSLRILSIGILTALLWVGTSTAETYQIDKSHSSVGFSVRHLVSRVPGKFSDVSGTITYDPAHPEMTSAEATIQTASINTDNERRDNHLRSADFFDAEKYPTITFKSTSAKKEGDKIMLTGNFTMHGVTKIVTLPVEVLGTGINPMRKVPMAGFATELTLHAPDYGVTSWANYVNVLGEDVKISITIEANAAKKE